MLYHGSKIGNIKVLKPNYSMHDKEYVYLSTLRTVALIYTSNAIERYFEINNLNKPKEFHNWYSYGFENKKPYLSEYYPDAIKETYSGVSGYIYVCDEPEDISNPTHIFCARVSEQNVKIISVEYIEDIYEEFIRLEKLGFIELRRFNDNTERTNEIIRKMIEEDISKYKLVENNDCDYSVFLRAKFPDLFKQN